MKKKLEDVKVVSIDGDVYNILTVPTNSHKNIKTPFCYYAVVEGPVGSDDSTRFVCVWEIKERIINALRDIFVVKMKEFYGGPECLLKSDEDILEIAQNLTENEYYFCDWDEPFDLYPINDKVDFIETVDRALCEKIMTCHGCGPNPGDCEDFIKRIK